MQIHGIPLVLGAVVLGRDVRRRDQLPARGVEVSENAGEEGDHGSLLPAGAESSTERRSREFPLGAAVVLPLPLDHPLPTFSSPPRLRALSLV